jgi:predicted acylesterase/phospholipase RssA
MSLNLSQDSKKKQCDLVMKGGITSGIVYPPLAIKLHDEGYSFRKVGGTSAGAIAAAVTAAAEHGKEKGGFEKLNQVREWLGNDRNLLNLFQPSRKTAPVLRTFLIYPKLKWLKILPLKLTVALLWGDLLFFILGAVLGAGLSILITWLVGGHFSGAGFYSILSVLALLGALLVTAIHLYLILTKGVPNNFFGLCTGRGRNPDQLDETALTDWLTVKINELAGKQKDDSPLTFSELWAQADSKDERQLDLRMMTSNLSQNRPYMLPFDDVYLFKKEEFEKLFPQKVVAHMVKHHRVIDNFNPPAGYFLFPEAKDLPVVVATRMSLSFPVLISMIPLYTISHNAFKTKVRFDLEPDPERSGRAPRIVIKEQNNDRRWEEVRQPLTVAKKGLQRNWFSDGGICSNFPIHFFDSWLPSRPTFGVNLTSQLGEQETGGSADTAETRVPQAADPRRFSYVAQQPLPLEYAVSSSAESVNYDTDVYLPQPGSEAVPEWIPISSTVKFLGSVFRTAQNYRDNMQAMLPSYYERIVQIRLSDQEGGLNLEMPPEVIERVVQKGDAAGTTLANDFNLGKHQWVRFRVLMGQMEKALRGMNDAMDDRGGTRVRPFDYPRLMAEQGNPALDYPFVRNPPWCDNATARLADIGKAIDAWKKPDLSEEPPLPEPALRVAPEI